jgi:predicted TIM-barrel fold metal-dependent hydrolase
MSIWLTAADLAKTAPAERAAVPSPIPTRVVSNGEYLPPPQTPAQRGVEARLAELAERHGKALGLSRRRFLRTSCGMAAAFLAMNAVYGDVFGVDPAEARDPDAAAARRARHAKDFVLDAQLHFVRDDFNWPGILALGEWAKRWNPVLAAEGVTMHRYKFENFVKEVYLDSDTRIGILSAAPADDPANSILDNDQMARARAVVNGLAGTRRLLSHAVFRPGQPGWLDDVDRAIAELKPDSWKGYTVGDPLSPSKWPWRMDDETLVYPAYERMQKAGIRTICIHKGLIPPDYEKTFEHWRHAMVDDVARAARDWPALTFVIYHSGLKPLMTPPDESLAQFDATGRMDWVTDLAEIPARHGVTNVYAELGTSFATSAVTHPRHAAALLGTLVKGMGADHVIWGTDSVWYGSPQWQIEAFRRIEIPDDMRERHGFAALGPADGAVKRAILGANAARLYALPAAVTAAGDDWDTDGLGTWKREYTAAGGTPSNAAYGFVRVRI